MQKVSHSTMFAVSGGADIEKIVVVTNNGQFIIY